MAKPILYRPAPRWQFWAFLGGALFLHGIGVIASIKHESAPVNVDDIPSYTIEASMEQPTDEPTPPPEDIPLQEPPPMPDVQPEFHEEVTPPPKRPPSTKVAPVKAPQQTAGPKAMSMSQAKTVAINSPRPEYPYEARSRHVTGSGVCVVIVDPSSGAVTDASMAQSLGNPILDNSALNTFRRWRFKPGTVSKVKIPITFTMTGASY